MMRIEETSWDCQRMYIVYICIYMQEHRKGQGEEKQPKGLVGYTSWMAWRDSSWRASLFGWLGESTGQALGNFQTPCWLVVTWTKPVEETSSKTQLSPSSYALPSSHSTSILEHYSSPPFLAAFYSFSSSSIGLWCHFNLYRRLRSA